MPNERLPDSYSATEVEVTYIEGDSLDESALVSDEKVPVAIPIIKTPSDELKVNASIQMYYQARAHISWLE